MLWGLTLVPGNVITETATGDVHLSMVALETRKQHGAQRMDSVQVILQTDNGKFVLCTLLQRILNQQSLDLQIKEGEQVSLYTEGTGVVHLTGNISSTCPPSQLQFKGDENIEISQEQETADSDSSKNDEDCWEPVLPPEIHIKQEPQDDDSQFMDDDSSITDSNFSMRAGDNNDTESSRIDDKYILKSLVDKISNANVKIENETEDDTGSSISFQLDSGQCASDNDQEVISPIVKTENYVQENEANHTIPGKKLSCKLCGKSFNNKSRLKIHMVAHSDERPYNCSWCGKGFKTACARQVHHRIHTGEKPYSCKICHKPFSDLGTCRRHEKIHSGETPFQCEYCGKSFPEMPHLTRHIRIHTGEKPYPCDNCPKRFSDRGQLKKHQHTHLRGKEREAYSGQCDICGKVLKDASSLKRHNMLHSEARPYVCTLCGKGFRDQSTLRQHYRSHNRLDRSNRVSCDYCSESFTDIPKWHEHIKRCTNVKTVVGN